MRMCKRSITLPIITLCRLSKPPSSSLITSVRPLHYPMAALKAVNVSDVPNLDQVHENASFTLYSSPRLSQGVEVERATSFKASKFMVIGHRGNGMNRLQSVDPRMNNMKENSILSFNTAASFNVDFIEFDVQVTSDGVPIVFHDNFIYTEENGIIVDKRVTDLSLSEFRGYGPQIESAIVSKPLLRKTKDGKMVHWNVESDDSLCTLQETFEKVNPKLGFNIELKFDNMVYEEDFLNNVLQSILKVVHVCANDRPIIFSSFHPDAILLMRKLQNLYPVYFLTNAGIEIYYDVRMNSLDEAIKLCIDGGLQGIVSEVKGIFMNPGAVSKIKDSKLSLLTYGTLNNVPESVYVQYLMGVEGVIVDYVQDITQAVNSLIKPTAKALEDVSLDGQLQMEAKPQFSKAELSFLLKLIPQLIQQ